MMAEKITDFFAKLPKDAPKLPIRWTATTQPAPKRVKRGPGRPRKVRKPEPTVIDLDPTDSDSEDEDREDGDDGAVASQIENDEEPRKIRHRYDLQQKKRVVDMAKSKSVQAAATYYHIPRTTINRWMVDGYFDVKRTSKNGNKLGKQGRPLTYDQDLDEALLAWLLEARDKHLPVSKTILKAKALEIISPTCPIFKASAGWIRQFMKRHHLALRCRTSMAQELPVTLEERIAAFHKHIKRVKELYNFKVVGNMDETPLFFDVVPNRVIASKGAKSVIVRTTGSEKRHLTVTLCVTTEGEVLPGLVIFKGKRPLKIREDGVFVRVQKKAWMDEDLMLEWIDLVWEPATERQRALLILDTFSAHFTDPVKKKLKEINTIPVLIPGGCTSKIQPLDVCLNKPFKSHVRKCWSQYVINESSTLATHQKIKPPTKELVTSWVAYGMKKLQEKPDMISRSFDVCGITTNSIVGYRPAELIEGQLCSDSEDDLDNPFLDDEQSNSDMEL